MPALRAVAAQAKERGGGARGLRGIMETVLLDAMYDVPGSGVRYVLVTKAVVEGSEKAGYWSRGEGTAFWSEWAKEEEAFKKTDANVPDV
jgi:ATP-dependent Clp protease ATP-binding subunit ClpX